VLLFFLRRPSSLQYQSDDTIADDQEPIQVSPKWQPDAPSHPPMLDSPLLRCFIPPASVDVTNIENEEEVAALTTTAITMEELYDFCRGNKWNDVLEYVNQHPHIGEHIMTMDNYAKTTIIHQAIANNSKDDTAVRAKVISTILQNTPGAAQITNSHGFLPLYVIASRSTTMDSTTKERLIYEIIDAYPDALTVAAGKGKRTPVHKIFTGMVMLFISHCFKDSHCICTNRLCVGRPYETHDSSWKKRLLYEGRAWGPPGSYRLQPIQLARKASHAP
jgi:hypothetical protein